MSVQTLISPLIVQALGWSLIHFLWQGLLLATLLRAVFLCCRSAQIRYWAAVVALVVMALAPVLTFTAFVRSQESSAVPAYAGTVGVLNVMGGIAEQARASEATRSFPAIDWAIWLAGAWFAGVFAFAFRLLGSWVLVQRFYRNKREALVPNLVEQCQALERRLRISRVVRYFQIDSLDAPAVIGWWRPEILLPVTALTGLSPEQLEAVIVHELAHIQRLDGVVNLFQLAVETLLFYHPAVWWVSGAIRREREHCCDDIAVRVCGSPGIYARALTLMETWRAAPELVLAANSGSLKSRVSRLLAPEGVRHGSSASGLAAIGAMFVAGALLASTNVAPNPPYIPSPQLASFRVLEQRTLPTLPVQKGPQSDVVDVAQADAGEAKAKPEESQNPRESSSQQESNEPSYIEGLRAAGLKDINVDELIAMKIQGVTPEYVREMHSAGLEPNIGEIIAMKVQGVTPEYVRTVRRSWPKTNVGEIIAMKVQGVSPADAEEFRRVGLNNLNVGQLIAFRVQGVTPAYVRGLQSAGFTNLSAGEIIGAKVQGVTPEFAQKVRSHGFKDVTLQQLIRLKTAGVF